jgi:hypothetical protein
LTQSRLFVPNALRMFSTSKNTGTSKHTLVHYEAQSVIRPALRSFTPSRASKASGAESSSFRKEVPHPARKLLTMDVPTPEYGEYTHG